MESGKLKVIMDYKKLSPDIQEKIQLAYPAGLDACMVSYKNSQGRNVLALRYETDETIYLLRMSEEMAMKIAETSPEDDDDPQNREFDLLNEGIGSDIDNLLDNNFLMETDGFIS